MASHSPLAGRWSIPVGMLDGRTLITYGPDSGLRPCLQAAFDAAGIDFTAQYATNDAALHVALVEAGVGVSLSVGTDRALTGNPRVNAVPIVPPLTYRKAMVWRAVSEMLRPLRAFLALDSAVP
ncbi:LysR family transcriptional regulator substrate-binding protein [Nonomuraea jabiensis]|uniref:LysR family transcriptional regulator substrate-binding protein n=1 Tax=Nonomuraea jabiensis TaxID=882448 RepID=UPI0036A00F96